MLGWKAHIEVAGVLRLGFFSCLLVICSFLFHFSQTHTLLQVLLLDESLAGLDRKTRLQVAGVLKDLKKRCTILVAFHDSFSPLSAFVLH